MKIAVISDTHDNLATLEKFLGYIRKNPVEVVIHCGDIAEGLTLAHLANGFTGKILAAFGNMDYRDSVRETANRLAPRIVLFEDFGRTKMDGLRIGFCHYKETALTNSKKEKFDYLFYGHTHKPWLENIDGTIIANPGTLAGMFYKSTFATLDTTTKKLDLVVTERCK